jgi:hypothetical protein
VFYFVKERAAKEMKIKEKLETINTMQGQANGEARGGAGKGHTHTKACFKSQMICATDKDDHDFPFDLSCLPAEEIANLVAARMSTTTSTTASTSRFQTCLAFFSRCSFTLDKLDSCLNF